MNDNLEKGYTSINGFLDIMKWLHSLSGVNLNYNLAFLESCTY